MCLLCAIVGVVIARMDVNIFTQIGFLVLVGLACKNAILIVEYAKAQREAGHSRLDATLEAVKLRLRPIIMTSFAFILGVVPLMVSEGAGAEMRRTLGTAVFSGMLGVTLFGIFLTPVFFYVIQGFKDRRPQAPPDADDVELTDDGRLAVLIRGVDQNLAEIVNRANGHIPLAPDELAALERGMARIRELLDDGRNGRARN